MAFACFFIFNRGAVDTWLHICAFLVLLNMGLKQYSLKDLFTGRNVFIIPLFLGLMISSIFAYSDPKDFQYVIKTGEALIIIISIHALYLKKDNYQIYYYTFLLLLALTVCWHAFSFYSAPTQYAAQVNKHVLSNFLIMVIPFLGFFLFTIKGKYKYFIIAPVALLTLVSLDILLKAHSRPAILGLLFACFILILFFLQGVKRLYCLVGLLLIISLILTMNYADIFLEMKKLVTDISHEERVLIWRDSWHMITKGSFFEILFGHGIGSFRYAFPQFSTSVRFAHLVCPHNFFLQFLYETGVVGFSLLNSLLILFVYDLIRVLRQSKSYFISTFGKCLLVYFIAWGIHCGLTVPFFSIYSLYPLMLIFGIGNILFLYKQKKIVLYMNSNRLMR